MNIKNREIIFLLIKKPVLFILLLILSACTGNSPAVKTNPAKNTGNSQSDIAIVIDNSIIDSPVSPADAVYQWEGRVDFTDSSAPVLAWSGASVSIKLNGSQFALHFGTGHGQNWFNIIVDGETFLLGAKQNRIYKFNIPLDNTEHSILIFKRSESQSGKIAFLGFSSPDGGFLKPEKTADRKIAFLGDSITAGACNEDQGKDQWSDRSTHNFYNSYASITARQLDAAVTGAVHSGMGVSTGWNEYKAWQVWNRQEAKPDAEIYPAEYPAPDVFIINLGENDNSFTKANGLPFPADFPEKYIQLVRDIRRRYPETLIICTLGGMYGGKRSSILNKAWQTAVEQLSVEDPLIRQFKFETVSRNHPRVSAHEMMAEELTAFISAETGW